MENESLDLREPGGQRWKHLLSAVRKKLPIEETVRQVELKLPKAIRKAFAEFSECGVSFSELLENRNDAAKLEMLVRKCKGHEYARLFQSTCIALPLSSDSELLVQFNTSILDRFQDQVRHSVLGNEWTSLDQLNDYQQKIKEGSKPDICRIADQLLKNPDRPPTVKPATKEQKSKDKETLLKTSLLGGRKS